MRHLAIDYGTRRVGLALSDEGAQFVSPLDVLFVMTPAAALDGVAKVIAAEDPKVLVLGLPINMDGTLGGAAKTVQQWADDLRKRTGLPVVFVDERLTSFEAEQQLIAQQRAGRKMTRQDKKKRLDALAAAIILKSYLDGQMQPLAGSDDVNPTQDASRSDS